MDKDKIQTYISVAKLYYESCQTQDQISKQLNLSRPTISRILQYCKDKNIVQIKIVNPYEDLRANELLLEQKYNLKKAIIAYSPINNNNEILQAICAKAASYLNDSICDGDIIGVCWGNTLYNIAKLLNPRMVRGVKIVQLKGGVSHSTMQTHAKEIVDIFTQKFNALGFYLPLPTLFSDLQTKQIVEKDPFVQDILHLGQQANVALFTVGGVNSDSILFKLGYVNAKERKILEKKAVGDIASRLIDIHGNICAKSLDDRTNGIELTDLKNKRQRILVAGGSHKWPAIKAALAGGYANILITDQYTAHELV